MRQWIPNTLLSPVTIAPTLFTEPIKELVSLIGMRALRTFMRETPNFCVSQIRNRETWQYGPDTLGLWSIRLDIHS
jgi:hypothetical protein